MTFYLYLDRAFITGWTYSLANVIAVGATNVTVGKKNTLHICTVVTIIHKITNFKHIALFVNNSTTHKALSIGSILKLTWDIDLSKFYLMFITLGITLFHGYLNVRDIGVLAILNQWSVFWSCTGLLLIITALSIMVPHQNASWVFTHYQNQTGFENPGYVLVLGMIGAAYSLFGKRTKYSQTVRKKKY